MYRQMITLGLIIGLMGIVGLNKNSWAQEEEIPTKTLNLTGVMVGEKIKRMNITKGESPHVIEEEARKGVKPFITKEVPAKEIPSFQESIVSEVEEEKAVKWPKEIRTPRVRKVEEVKRKPRPEIQAPTLTPTLTEEVRGELQSTSEEIQIPTSAPILDEEVGRKPQLSREEIRKRIAEEWKERLKNIKPPAKPVESGSTSLTEKREKVRIPESPKSK